MLEEGKKCQCVSGLLHPLIGVVLITALSPSAGKAQARTANDSLQARDIGIIELDRGIAHTGAQSVPSDRVRRITLEQVKQSADPAAKPLARLGQLSVEAAREHRLGVQAQYFPKFSATFFNLHFTEPLGQVITVRRPILGMSSQFPIAVFGQDQTFAALSFVQPITPILQVRQAVRIARADERIAMAKASAPVARRAREEELEGAYFKLLIAQRQLLSAERKLKSPENRSLYATTAVQLVHTQVLQPESVEARIAFETAVTKVRELTTSLNRAMGWPDDTPLDLVLPDPLVENVSLEEIADKPVGPNPDVVEAEQTVIKARAALTLSKLEYVPTVAAVSGYLFQNVIPSVPSNFGYGGVIASYTLFDFGKRERDVKEARARLGMAEIALQLTKAKVASNLKKSYTELERSRQLSQIAQKMGSSVAALVNVSANPESMEVRATRAEVELEMLEADLAHRRAFAQFQALRGQR
jgi:outer membrane protein TolC